MTVPKLVFNNNVILIVHIISKAISNVKTGTPGNVSYYIKHSTGLQSQWVHKE